MAHRCLRESFGYKCPSWQRLDPVTTTKSAFKPWAARKAVCRILPLYFTGYWQTFIFLSSASINFVHGLGLKFPVLKLHCEEGCLSVPYGWIRNSNF